MRLTVFVLALASVAATLPGGAQGQEAPPPPPRLQRVPPPPPSQPPPPPPGMRSYPRTVPAQPYARSYPYYRRPHFWWGWGWGWGWYPLYGYAAPQPPPPGYYAPQPRREAERIFTRFSLYGAGRSDGYVGGVDFGLDARYTGFDLAVNAIARESVTGPLHASESDPATWGSAHFTWSFLSEPSIRLRIETGASVLSLPGSQFTASQPWRGKTIFGPDVGISGQMGLVGPLGIEGHARLTPFPVRVADTLIAATVHGGPVGLSAGWRWIDVAGNGTEAPKLMFRGPQVGLSIAF